MPVIRERKGTMTIKLYKDEERVLNRAQSLLETLSLNASGKYGESAKAAADALHNLRDDLGLTTNQKGLFDDTEKDADDEQEKPAEKKPEGKKPDSKKDDKKK